MTTRELHGVVVRAHARVELAAADALYEKVLSRWHPPAVQRTARLRWQNAVRLAVRAGIGGERERRYVETRFA